MTLTLVLLLLLLPLLLLLRRCLDSVDVIGLEVVVVVVLVLTSRAMEGHASLTGGAGLFGSCRLIVRGCGVSLL